LRQGYVQLGGRESNEPFIRFGRQEITYGNNRIIGDADWGNSAREFDAVRARYYHWGTNFEFVAGSVVLQDPNRFDRHKPGEHLYGTYETLDKLVPKAVIEPYLFGKTALNVIPEIGPHGNSTEYVSGLRFAGKLPAHVDYSLETVHEGGNYAGDRIAALGEVYTLGWTVMQSHWAPRISADYSYASGDSNPKDGVHGTFDQMYGNAQPFFSLTGLIGWKNIRDTREGVDFAPAKHVKIFVDYRDFNLATVKDGLYNGQGTRVFLNPNAASDHVGEGIDTKVSIEWPKAFTTSFGVGTLFAGAYLQELKQQNTYVYPYFTWAKRF
ncbi:MAG: alginate export family protein, partial [Acidobacteriaceae bacterium]|nr:alginate export family protein [Acidobacteriaceae bacterium]